jgi:hypothetical protein
MRTKIMVDNFFKKVGDFLASGVNNNQDEQDEYSDSEALPPTADRNVRPSSEDPYGDPADQDYSNAIPASQDPYGDPADQGYANAGYNDQYGNLTPASQDPYGDPADQESYSQPIPASEDPYGDPADDEYRR